MRRIITILRLALADYRADALLSACGVLALAAAMLPLLVILGVQQGLVGSLTGRLLSDPRNLEIRPAGTGQYSLGWIEDLRGNSGVAFIIPQTRSISAQLELFPPGSENLSRAVKVDLLPSDSGDPLLERWKEFSHGGPAKLQSVILSSSAARKLEVETPGAEIRARVSRRVDGAYEQEYFTLTVQGVLPLEAEQRDIAYGRLALLEAVENYRDGRAAPALALPGEPGPESRQVYASFRLYAQNLEAVEPLNELLLAQGIETYTRAEEIASVRNLDQAFTFMGALLLGVVGSGFLASAISSALALVGRKQRSLGVLRLLGFTSGHLALFPLVQAALTGLLGSLLSLAMLFTVQEVINRAFSAQVMPGEKVCDLSLEFALLAILIATSIMLAGALAASRKVTLIEPSELIREV